MTVPSKQIREVAVIEPFERGLRCPQDRAPEANPRGRRLTESSKLIPEVAV